MALGARNPANSLPVLVALGCFAIGACSIGEQGQDSIFDAAQVGDLDRVRALASADPELLQARDGDGMTPLHRAAFGGQAALAEFLVEEGADLEAVDAERRTPLHHAAFRGDATLVDFFISNGADVMATEFRGRSPLFLATNWGDDLQTVEALIAAGADVNHVTSGGEAMLLQTLYYGLPEIVSALLDAGSRLPDSTEGLARAAYLSASNGFEDVFDLAVTELASRAVPWWEGVPLHAAARGGSVAIGERLLAEGAGVNRTNEYGITPLHIAAENGRPGFTDLLIRSGAGLELTSRMGLTALHFAREGGHASVESALLAAGAIDAPPIFPELTGPYLGQTEPVGETAEIFALGIVSGHHFESEHSPTAFSPDGTEVFWTQAFRGPVVTSRLSDGLWTAPEPAPFLSEHGEGEPIFSPDGQRLYFISMRPVTPGSEGGKENLWFVDRESDGWSDPVPVSQAVNEYDHHWLFSEDEQGTLYFSSIRASGYGRRDLFRAEMVDGVHQPPVSLGPDINTEGDDHTPFIAPDGSYLIFASSSHDPPDGERFHLVISFRQPDGGWSEPQSLSHRTAPANNPLCPMISPDGRFMFFIGSGDIWWTRADFIEEMRGTT